MVRQMRFVKKHCKFCGKEFEVPFRKREQKNCSPECFKKGLSKDRKGWVFSKERNEKLSKSRIGHKVSEETRSKQSKTMSGRPGNHTGYKMSKGAKQKISKANLGRETGKREIRICPTCKKEFRILVSDPKIYCCKKCFARSENQMKIFKTIGRKRSQKTIQKMRKSAIKRIKEKNGNCCPNFNPKATKFFKSFDLKNNTKGIYRNSETNQQEFYIKELGYFPDYINFDLRLIMEFDEKTHFDISGNLREKDLQRQKEIQEFYPDFKFRRINEE